MPTVLLATRSVLFADSLASALSETEFNVVASVYDAATATQELRARVPDLAVLVSDLTGTDAVLGVCRAALADDAVTTAVLVIGHPGSEQEMKEVLDAGALGYALAQSALSDLVQDMRAVLTGEARVPGLMLGGLLRSLIARERKTGETLERYASLSKRERETLALLAQGQDHVQIAATMVISSQTARTHIQNVLGKLGVHSRLEAADLARRNGWVKSDRRLTE